MEFVYDCEQLGKCSVYNYRDIHIHINIDKNNQVYKNLLITLIDTLIDVYGFELIVGSLCVANINSIKFNTATRTFSDSKLNKNINVHIETNDDLYKIINHLDTNYPQLKKQFDQKLVYEND